MSGFAVQLVNTGNGERMPFLVDIFTGLGNYDATAFSLTFRSKGLQVNTLVQALRFVQFLYETLSESGISLLERAKDSNPGISCTENTSVDEDAAWVKKGKKAHYGYRSYVTVEETEGYVRGVHTAPANESETTHFIHFCDRQSTHCTDPCLCR